eukprot:TRINITY_DN62381_c0_g1_i1.p1 TRINITY_DN62381_c0_g1~~TRINITY_DN62381_c0_g1_i1.p1  ORF type:complete len:268 (-),score=59.43 TRINITY_DN62381_c0_g1_i1:327-1130(-)
MGKLGDGSKGDGKSASKMNAKGAASGEQGTKHVDGCVGSSAEEQVLCKFFGSAKGCTSHTCKFSHANPNSVANCSFKQRTGFCQRGESCTFRHVVWASPEQAIADYAARDVNAIDASKTRYKQLHRDTGEPLAIAARLQKEHLELPPDKIVEKEIQEETYGSAAMRMMEKMGYKAGGGLGKHETGQTKLSDACMSLERASTQQSLGFGTYDPSRHDSAATRVARMADARAKRAKLETSTVMEHKLLSDSDSSDDNEIKHSKVRNVQL